MARESAKHYYIDLVGSFRIEGVLPAGSEQHEVLLFRSIQEGILQYGHFCEQNGQKNTSQSLKIRKCWLSILDI